jgi:hypothetical protein
MAFRNGAQFPHEGDFVIRPPRRDRQPAVRQQRPPHLSRRRSLVGKELQPLLAAHDVKLLTVAERQRTGIAIAPVDARRHGARHGQHFGADINADDVSPAAKPLLCNARHNTCAAGNIEHAIAGFQVEFCNGHFGKRAEEGSDNRSLIRLCEICLLHRIAGQRHGAVLRLGRVDARSGGGQRQAASVRGPFIGGLQMAACRPGHAPEPTVIL